MWVTVVFESSAVCDQSESCQLPGVLVPEQKILVLRSSPGPWSGFTKFLEQNHQKKTHIFNTFICVNWIFKNK